MGPEVGVSLSVSAYPTQIVYPLFPNYCFCVLAVYLKTENVPGVYPRVFALPVSFLVPSRHHEANGIPPLISCFLQ